MTHQNLSVGNCFESPYKLKRNLWKISKLDYDLVNLSMTL